MSGDIEELKWSGAPIKCEINVLNKAEGSAIVSQGNNVVTAALYGPYELKHMRIQDDLAFQVNFKTKSWVQGNSFKSTEDLIRSACESIFFPKNFARHESTLLVQEMQDAGLILSCAVNAGCLAMISSGMEMQHLVAASCCSMDESGDMIIDPTQEQINKAKMIMTVAFESVNYNIVMINYEGSCTSEQHSAAIAVCRSAAKEVISYFKRVVEKYCKVIETVEEQKT